jgi:hypothetical protein
MDIGRSSRSVDLVHRYRSRSVGDILGDRGIEQVGRLRHYGDMFSKPSSIGPIEGMFVKQDGSASWFVQALK